MSTPSRPPLVWHGGKWKLAPWITAQFPPHRVYVEPYGGGASVLLRKPRAKHEEVWNDLDGDVVALFRALRDDPEGLVRAVENTPFARAEFEAAYRITECDFERARRLLVRSHLGFGTAGSSGRKTGFKGKSGRAGTSAARSWASLPPALRDVAERFRGVVVESRPALDLIADRDGEGVLFYVDPPYLPETRDAGADYRVEMSAADHEALLAALTRVRGHVVLSGYPSRLYDQTLAGWRRLEAPAFADGGRRRVEVLWLNFSDPCRKDLERDEDYAQS